MNEPSQAARRPEELQSSKRVTPKMPPRRHFRGDSFGRFYLPWLDHYKLGCFTLQRIVEKDGIENEQTDMEWNKA